VASDADRAQRFFVLTAGMDSPYDTEFDTEDPLNLGEAPRCPSCGGFVGGLPWRAPYRVNLELYGSEAGDFAEGTGDERLISERFAEAFRTEGLTGFESVHPVEVLKTRYMKRRRGRSQIEIPRYCVVYPCFGRGKVDVVLNRMRFKAAPTCRECGYAGVDAVHGFVLEPGTWGGEDVFRPRGLTGKIVVSERFKGLVERHGFTNVVLTPTEEYVWDPSNLGPAPLPEA